MKKSNIGLVALAVVFLGAWLGNIYYHKVNLENKKPFLLKSELFERVRDSLKVVCVKDSTHRLKEVIDVISDKNNQMEVSCETGQFYAFYENFVVKGDTLVVSNLYSEFPQERKKADLTINLPHVKAYFYNGELVKSFENQITN